MTGNPGGPIPLAKSAHTGPKLMANDMGHGGVGMIDISIADIVESRCQSWRRRGGDDVPAGAAPKAESFPT